MSLVRGVIVAGGRGTRLGALGKNFPKALLPIGKQPLLAHQLAALFKSNISEIFTVGGYAIPLIEEFVKTSNVFPKKVNVIKEEWPAGSGGCLQFLPNTHLPSLIIFGDIFFSFDLVPFIQFHFSQNSKVSLVLQNNDHPQESDLVLLDKSYQCLTIRCKPHNFMDFSSYFMVAGLFIVEPEIIQSMTDSKPLDLVHDCIAPLIDRREHIAGYYTDAYCEDIGTPERYKKANLAYTQMLHGSSRRKS